MDLYIKNVTNLVPLKQNERLDTYLEATLLPEEPDKSKQKSEIVKNKLNPEYNASFHWTGFNREDLKNKSLEIKVWTQEKAKSQTFLGGVYLNTGNKFNKWLSADEKESSIWLMLIDNKKPLSQSRTFELDLKKVN